MSKGLFLVENLLFLKIVWNRSSDFSPHAIFNVAFLLFLLFFTILFYVNSKKEQKDFDSFIGTIPFLVTPLLRIYQRFSSTKIRSYKRFKTRAILGNKRFFSRRTQRGEDCVILKRNAFQIGV